MSQDEYDHMNREKLLEVIRIRGKPNWADFSTSTIRELLHADDLDREDA